MSITPSCLVTNVYSKQAGKETINNNKDLLIFSTYMANSPHANGIDSYHFKNRISAASNTMINHYLSQMRSCDQMNLCTGLFS